MALALLNGGGPFNLPAVIIMAVRHLTNYHGKKKAKVTWINVIETY